MIFYLCETCGDAMTDLVIPGTQTDTGFDEARCLTCCGTPESDAAWSAEDQAFLDGVAGISEW